MVVVHRRWLVLVVAAAVVSSVARPVPAADLPVVPVVVATQAGEHLFRAEVVRTAAEQARGLMFREHLEPDAGMLFVFEPPRPVSFWMKNTLIPLDMLFVDPGGRIVAIAERTEPHSLAPVGPEVPVALVLEINGGLAERLGIRPGDRLRVPALP